MPYWKAYFISIVYSVVGAAVALNAAAADFYKTVDANGRPAFSDRPQAGAKKVTVDVRSANPEDAERLAREQSDAARYSGQLKYQQKDAEPKLAEREAARQRRVDYCDRTRDRQRMFAEGGVIFRRNEEGKREYYSSAEIEQKRVELQDDLDTYCSD